MSEEVEVHVRQIDDEMTASENPPFVEMLRRMLLASIGAVAMTADEAEQFIQRLVERGELAQKDGEKLINEMMARFRQKPQEAEAKAQAKADDFGSKMESSVEQFLNRLNVPSKRDIDELSARVAQLAARVEEVRRTQPGDAGHTKTPPVGDTP
jgi:poly(hydroxyalkanoate) granule-associated protein